MPEATIKWTAANIEKLRKLTYDEGLPASLCGEAMGVSRSAICAKWKRLGWSVPSSRLSAVKKRRRGHSNDGHGGGPQIQAAAKVPLIKHDPLTEVNANRVPKVLCITGLNANTCRWPIGEVGKEDFGYCGDLPEPGQPYCPHHHRIAHETLSARTRRMERTETERNSEKRKNWASFA